MRVAVTGANSAVGRALLALPEAGGASLVACVRSERAERQLPALPPGARVARVDYADADSLGAAFAGAGAVIHLPGVLVERPGSSYEIANVETTRSVIAAARKCDVPRLVLVSALGADAASANRYYRTKGEAEDLVRESGLGFAILRAPLVLGPGTEGAAALRRHTERRRAWLLGGGRHWQRPIDVADVARAALGAARPGPADGRALDLVGPEAVLDRELVERAARARGRVVAIRAVPVGPVRLAAALRQRLAGPGFSPDAVDVITADTRDDTGAAAELGLTLTPLEVMIRRSVEEETA